MIRRESDRRPSQRPPLPVILYVEDDQESWQVTELRMREHYTVRWAPDDVEACRVVRAEGPKLYAVLMDITLKRSLLDGTELCQLFKGKLKDRDLPPYAQDLPVVTAPILFLSGHRARYSEAELQRMEGHAMITKPVDFLHLTLALASLQPSRRPPPEQLIR
jgi:CheY-like chemotaxis protein